MTLKFIRYGCVLALSSLSMQTPAESYQWIDWISATEGLNGSATGYIAVPNAGVAVQYSGEVTLAQTEQTTDTANYFTPTETYGLPNAPPSGEMVALSGTQTQAVNTLHFSKPVTNPVMAIVSLGTPDIATRYQFNTPFSLLKQGSGYWGTGSLEAQEGNVLVGQEGDGVIQFQGTVESISWTVTGYEEWHGFTIGLKRPETINPPCFLNDSSQQPKYDVVTKQLTLPHVIVRFFNAAFIYQKTYHYYMELKQLNPPESGSRFVVKKMELIPLCQSTDSSGGNRRLASQSPAPAYYAELPYYRKEGVFIPYLKVGLNWYQIEFKVDPSTDNTIQVITDVRLLDAQSLPASVTSATALQ